MTSIGVMPVPTVQPRIAVIGGSGFYSLFDAGTAREVEVDTPFGAPSAPVSVGEVDGVPVAFLPRHGKQHQFSPTQLNYRANLWALRSLGVRRVFGPCAVGGLDETLDIGSFVVADQFIDRTLLRPRTVYDSVGHVVHVAMADPYCPDLRRSLVGSAQEGQDVRDGGTLVVIEGPRFSTRAESVWHRSMGGTVVGMTGAPEATIARELAMCYATICLVTDMDAGVDEGSAVSHASVLEAFAGNVEVLKSLVLDAVRDVSGRDADCGCAQALDGMKLPFELP